MPAATYKPLANITLSANATAITFTSISQAYRDLVLVSNGLSDSSGNEILARFNDDAGSNYSFVQMYGTGSAAASNVGTNTFAGAGRQGTAGTASIFTIFDYATTDKHKSMLVRGDLASQYTTAQAERWASNSAITKILLFPGTGNFISGATFSLYGVIA